ncbi:MAG: PQQ-binding-like beta-propeller repeat protein [Clostridia bacterium]|nr:PQQ-binding-like beta-propeller repeat protein [Clostridia bacterium]
MSDYGKPGSDTRDLRPVREGERHRRAGGSGTAPFSRVSGSLHAADTTAPVQGLPAENQDSARTRTVYADNEPLSSVRRPVQAEGYSERRHAQTDRTMYDPPEKRELRPPVRPGAPGSGKKTPLLIALAVLLVALLALGYVIWSRKDKKDPPPAGTAVTSETQETVQARPDAADLSRELPSAEADLTETPPAATPEPPAVTPEPAAPADDPAPPFALAEVTCDRNEGTAPLTVTFTIVTDTSVSDVQLRNDLGEVLDGTYASDDEDGRRVWTMTHTFEQPDYTVLSLEVMNDGRWIAIGSETEVYITEGEEEDAFLFTDEDEPGADDGTDPLTADADTVPDIAETPEPIPSTLIVTSTVAPAAASVTLAPTNTPPIITQVPLEMNSATPEPEVTEEPVQTPEPAAPEATAVPDAEDETETDRPRRIEVKADESASPDQIKTVKIFNDKKKLTTYVRAAADEVDLPDADHYMPRAYGVLTFRASSFRQNAASGNIGTGALTGMSQIWQSPAGSMKAKKTTYYGIGKGSQPAIILWSRDVRARTNILEEKRGKTGLKEVIIAGEDGRIYFLDLDDGVSTRDAINLGYPMRATPTVHSYGQPYMAVGQFARQLPNRNGKIGLRTYNLLTQKELMLLNGLESDYRNTRRTIAKNSDIIGSFNTSPLIDTNSGTMISAGSNGLLYVTALGASTDMNENKLTVKNLNQNSVVFASQAAKEKAANVAVESSLAGYQNWVFYADKGGWLRSVDVNSLTVGWAADTGDTVESAVALDLDSEEHLRLYTANTLQLRNKGDAQIRCYDAETGKEIWTLAVPVAKPKKNAYTAGVVASPVIGTQGLGDYVYYTVSGLTAEAADQLLGSSEAVPAALICIEKATGSVKWAYALESYSYSSPVAVYNESGRGWIIQAESNGTMHLLDGETGSFVQSLTLEGAINGSPAVYRRILVIGTQGKNASYIYGFHLDTDEE